MPPPPLEVRNIHLAAWGVGVAVCGLLTQSGDVALVRANGLLGGYNGVVWTLVAVQVNHIRAGVDQLKSREAVARGPIGAGGFNPAAITRRPVGRLWAASWWRRW
jgi:hypothetical protein